MMPGLGTGVVILEVVGPPFRRCQDGKVDVKQEVPTT